MDNNKTKRLKILGSGFYAPDKILTNADLEKMVDTSDEWITTRTGIKERRIASEEQASSDMGIIAARRALADAGLRAKDMDLIIVATSTPDTIFPSTACWIQSGLGAGHVPAFDLSAGCTGFIYGLIVAESFLRAGTVHRILLIGAELLTKFTNWKDRNTCVLFGDAAAAFVLGESDNESGLLATYWKADGDLAEIITFLGGGTRNPASHQTVDQELHYLRMKGSEVFKHAVKMMGEAAVIALKKAGLEKEDISFLIAHQANIRIVEATGRRLKLPPEKVYVNIHKYGNVSVATIPIGLHELKEEGRLNKGDIIVMDAFGAGATWGAVVYRW